MLSGVLADGSIKGDVSFSTVTFTTLFGTVNFLVPLLSEIEDITCLNNLPRAEYPSPPK